MTFTNITADAVNTIEWLPQYMLGAIQETLDELGMADHQEMTPHHVAQRTMLAT